MSDGMSSGIVDKALDVVGAAADIAADEIKKTTSTATQQVANQPQKPSQQDDNLTQRAQQDQNASKIREEQIKKELAQMHFNEVQNWNLSPQRSPTPEPEEPEFPSHDLGEAIMPGSVNSYTSQALGNALTKTETGRGKKG